MMGEAIKPATTLPTPSPLITANVETVTGKPAPISPPIRAWLLLLGRPRHQVNKFQIIAASKAQITMV